MVDEEDCRRSAGGGSWTERPWAGDAVDAGAWEGGCPYESSDLWRKLGKEGEFRETGHNLDLLFALLKSSTLNKEMVRKFLEGMRVRFMYYMELALADSRPFGSQGCSLRILGVLEGCLMWMPRAKPLALCYALFITHRTSRFLELSFLPQTSPPTHNLGQCNNTKASARQVLLHCSEFKSVQPR
jgi:hypothetical protein